MIISTDNSDQFHKIGVWIVVLLSFQTVFVIGVIIYSIAEDFIEESNELLYLCGLVGRFIVFIVIFTIIIVPIYQIDDDLAANLVETEKISFFDTCGDPYLAVDTTGLQSSIV